MIPPQFDYHAPDSLDDAIRLLGELGDDAKVMSGGQSLLPMLKLRLAGPAHIVDIGRISGLAEIEEKDGYLHIGALVKESTLERNELVAGRYPILLDTARVIADPIVRNRATVGGNLAHGDPANDHPATMLAVRAEVVAHGPDGERVIPIDEFFFGLFMTALQPGEILTAIRIPEPTERSGGAYFKLERKVGDYAVAGAAVQLTLDADGKVEQAGIGLTNLGMAPIRAADAEEALVGHAPDDDTIAAAARAAADATEPIADRRGSVEYKTNMARVLTARAIRKALERAGE
jgi:carbon-monoxide dehydrogenase medium subunit